VCVIGLLPYLPQLERNLVRVKGVASVPLVADGLRHFHDHENLASRDALMVNAELYRANQVAYFNLVDSLLHCLSLFHIV